MNGGDVGGFIAEDYTAIPEDEGTEGEKESEIGEQAFEDEKGVGEDGDKYADGCECEICI